MTDYAKNLDLLKADDRRSVNHYETKMAARTEVMDSSSESEFSGFETVSVSTDEYNVSTDEYYNVSTDPDSDVEGGATARPARQRRRQPAGALGARFQRRLGTIRLLHVISPRLS